MSNKVREAKPNASGSWTISSVSVFSASPSEPSNIKNSSGSFARTFYISNLLPWHFAFTIHLPSEILIRIGMPLTQLKNKGEEEMDVEGEEKDFSQKYGMPPLIKEQKKYIEIAPLLNKC